MIGSQRFWLLRVQRMHPSASDVSKLHPSFDIISNARTAPPSGQRNHSLLSWRFSLRVQRFIRSRCSQSIEIRFVGLQPLRNPLFLPPFPIGGTLRASVKVQRAKARGSMTRHQCRSTVVAETASCNTCVVSCGEFKDEEAVDLASCRNRLDCGRGQLRKRRLLWRNQLSRL